MAERTIVVGMDDLSGARSALDWALRHASDTGATVEVVSAYSLEGTDWFDPEGPLAQREVVEERQRKDVEAALLLFDRPPTVHTHVIHAATVEALLQASAGADLLVLGSHGRGNLGTALMGTTAQRCIRRGSTPVIVVPIHVTAARR